MSASSPEHSRSKSLQHSRTSSLSSAPSSDKKDYILGIGLLLLVVFLWNASNFVTQDLFDDGYEKPFLVTYLNTSAFTLYLVPYALRRIFRGRRETRKLEADDREYQPLVDEDDDHDRDDHSPARRSRTRSRSGSRAEEVLPPLTTKETAKLAFIFCFFWFVANWSLNVALDYTSVASATILSAMSGFFTLGIGRMFRVEIMTLAKICAVCASFGGVVIVSLSDSSQTPTPNPSPPADDALTLTLTSPTTTVPLLGDFLALLSALFYALYVILLKVRIRSESRIDMQLFFGFVGLFNILSCWPLGVALHLSGVERFELPGTGKAVGALLVNMAITWSSDYIYVLAMLKTTPLVVTIGLSLTIPLAVLGDFFLNRPAKAEVILGAAVVLISFVVVGVEDAKVQERGRVEGGGGGGGRRRSRSHG